MFDALTGQNQAKKILSHAIEQDRVSHAYLFKGPSGVGKEQAARSFATRINCKSAIGGESCMNCSSCKKMAAGTHPDFITIVPDGVAIKIDQIRTLKKNLTYPPFEAGNRVILISDIHNNLKRREVANSLLKTLEEPPVSTVFILTTDETSDLLPTIVSRCQVVPFYPLAQQDVEKALIKKGADPSIAQQSSAACAGSLSQAEKLAENNHLQLVQEIVGYISTLKPEDSKSIEVLFQTADKLGGLKDELLQFLDLLKLWYGDCLKAHELANKAFFTWPDLYENSLTAKQRWNLSELSDKVAHINLAQKQINANCNKSFVCEVLFWNLIQ